MLLIAIGLHFGLNAHTYFGAVMVCVIGALTFAMGALKGKLSEAGVSLSRAGAEALCLSGACSAAAWFICSALASYGWAE